MSINSSLFSFKKMQSVSYQWKADNRSLVCLLDQVFFTSFIRVPFQSLQLQLCGKLL